MLLGMPLEGPEVPRYEQICEPSESNSAATVFAPGYGGLGSSRLKTTDAAAASGAMLHKFLAYQSLPLQMMPKNWTKMSRKWTKQLKPAAPGAGDHRRHDTSQ